MQSIKIITVSFILATLLGCATTKSSLQQAWELGDSERVKQELVVYKQKGARTASMLENAIIRRDYKFAQFLVEQGADFTRSKSHGYNAFIRAVSFRPLSISKNPQDYQARLDLVKTILERVVDVDEHNVWNFSGYFRTRFPERQNSKKVTGPLQISASYLNTQVMQLLIDKGADPNWVSNHSALASVVKTHTFRPKLADKALNILLTVGADLNQSADFWGNNALYYAIESDNIPLYKRLVKLGVDPYHENHNGNNAFKYLADYRKRQQKARRKVASPDSGKLFNALVSAGLGYSAGKIAGLDSAQAMNVASSALEVQLTGDVTGSINNAKALARKNTLLNKQNNQASTPQGGSDLLSAIKKASPNVKPDYFTQSGKSFLAQCEQKDWGDGITNTHCLQAMQYYAGYLQAHSKGVQEAGIFYDNHVKAAQLGLNVINELSR